MLKHVNEQKTPEKGNDKESRGQAEESSGQAEESRGQAEESRGHHGNEDCMFEEGESLGGAPVIISVEEIERLKTEMAISFSNPPCK